MIRILWIISFFIVGAIMGSFFNVLGMRLPKGESIVFPGSNCPRCGHNLKWYELIPIISYLFLGGKCRNCKQPISIMYPFIELFSGVLYAVSFYSFGFSYDLIISLTIASLLVAVIVSDVSYMIIPDSFIITSGIIIILAKLLSLGLFKTMVSIGYGLIGFIFLLLVMFLGNKLFHKESLGGADIKLFFIVGLVFDPLRTILVLLVASFLALPVALMLYFKNKESIIPFGPFIVLSLLFVYFTKIDFSEIIAFLTKH